MPSTHKRYKRTNKKRSVNKHGSRKQRGGSSAWQYVLDTVGPLNAQLSRTLDVNTESNVATRGSNALYSASSVNSQNQPMINSNLSGGRRKRKLKQKGGVLGSVLANAFVPFSLLGLQHKYKNRKSLKHKK